MLRGPPSAPANKMLRSGDHLAPLSIKTNSTTTTTRRQGEQLATPATGIALLQCCSNAASHCRNGVLLQCLSALPQYPFQCSYCRNIATMLMLLAMPFNIAATHIAAILKRIAAMLPLLHHCGNAAIARGIAAMPFGIATTPHYFPDGKKTGTRKIFFKRERVSFLSRSCKF